MTLRYMAIRSGRTGRAGRTGHCYSLLSSRERNRVRGLERMVGKAFTALPIPSAADVTEPSCSPLLRRFIRQLCPKPREQSYQA